MTDTFTSPAAAPASPTPSVDPARAGALLRAARQQQGLHIAALAATIKVTPAKLEALEAGRFDELLDATFARALALTVCRVLKIDPTPVLAHLPGAPPRGLERVDGGLNTPFHERPGRVVPADLAPWRHPVLWGVALLLIAAAAFVLVPSSGYRAGVRLPGSGDATDAPVMPPGGVVEGAVPADIAASAASAADAPSGGAAADSPAAAVPLAASSAAPLPPPADAAASATAAGAGEALALHAREVTWVQVVDGNGQTLISRLVPAGETVTLSARPPLRVKIGNVRGAQLSFRGKPVDLSTAAHDNTASLTLP